MVKSETLSEMRPPVLPDEALLVRVIQSLRNNQYLQKRAAGKVLECCRWSPQMVQECTQSSAQALRGRADGGAG